MKFFYGLLVVALVAGASFAQSPLTLREALSVVETATGDYKGTRAEHVLVQDSLRTIAAALSAYEQYFQPVALPAPVAPVAPVAPKAKKQK